MQKRIKIIIPVFYCLSSTHLVYANGNDKYVLDDSLFKNQSSETIKLLQKISDDEYSPGLYNVDIYVNGKYIDRQEIKFTEVNDSGVKPCFDNQVLKKIGISKKILENINESQESCIFLSDYLEVNVDFNFSNLKLNLSIAQNDLVNLPRGYTDPELWNSGSSILFLNYIASAYHSSIDSDFGNQKQTSGFLSINGGINFENWQYRQQSNLNYNKGGETTWNNTRSYLTRPIEKIQGNVLLGQTYTSGRFFSGLRFTGLNVSSDERMLPQSMRGYAPTIQGIAKSNAKVSIFQNNRIIYETSVAAGAFVINDLYPTSYNGNLLVKVEEADGSISEFTVPFSSVPQSLRTGAFKYNIDAGKTKDIGDDSYFSDASIQYGLRAYPEYFLFKIRAKKARFIN